MSNQNEHISDKEIVEKVSDLLKKYHIRPDLLGYDYIFYILCYNLKYDGNFKNLHKVVYPIIAKKFNTNIKRVERCITSAIETTSWSDTYDQILYNYGKINNSLFLSILLNDLRKDNISSI